jgi:hypothetical protein
MIRTAFCHVSGSSMMLSVDLEGTVDRVICPWADSLTKECRLKRRETGDGPLGQLLARVNDRTLTEPGLRCRFLP